MADIKEKISKIILKKKLDNKNIKTSLKLILLTIDIGKKITKKKLNCSQVLYYLPIVSEKLYDMKVISEDLFVKMNEFDNEELVELVDDLMSIRGCFMKLFN